MTDGMIHGKASDYQAEIDIEPVSIPVRISALGLLWLKAKQEGRDEDARAMVDAWRETHYGVPGKLQAV